MGFWNVFLEIAIDGQTIGKVIIELFDSVVPETARNFRELCTGQNGYGYKDCVFHRIIPGRVEIFSYKLLQKNLITYNDR